MKILIVGSGGREHSIAWKLSQCEIVSEIICAPGNAGTDKIARNINNLTEDIKSILIIGAGPIIIGQACEFDYSGTQAARALKEEGYKIILVNSNPATIMTDPEIADRTYIEPITLEYVSEIIKRERPDAILPTVGGQTA